VTPINYPKEFRRKLAEGKDLDTTLSELRASGASIMDCVSAVHSFRKCEIIEAKRIVHFSPAWKDVMEATDASFRDFNDNKPRHDTT
jgi:hypothetical protein